MKKFTYLSLFLLISSLSFSFFNFNINTTPDDPAYYESDDSWESEKQESKQQELYKRKKVYIPNATKIYKDERGEYFYVGTYNKDNQRMGGGSGGFMVKYLDFTGKQKSAINAQLALDNPSVAAKNGIILWGGGGYWHASNHFYLGGSGAGGLITSGTGSNRLKFAIGYGGLDFLILVPIGNKNFNLVLGSLIGAGGMELASQTSNKFQKTFWVVEPKAGIQINFTPYFAMRLMGSYLYSQDIDSKIEGTLANIDFDENLALRNLNLTILFEWGRF